VQEEVKWLGNWKRPKMNFKIYQVFRGEARRTEQLIKNTERLVKRMRNRSQFKGHNFRGFILMHAQEDCGYIGIHYWQSDLTWGAFNYRIDWRDALALEVHNAAQVPDIFNSVIEYEYRCTRSLGYFNNIYGVSTLK